MSEVLSDAAGLHYDQAVSAERALLGEVFFFGYTVQVMAALRECKITPKMFLDPFHRAACRFLRDMPGSACLPEQDGFADFECWSDEVEFFNGRRQALKDSFRVARVGYGWCWACRKTPCVSPDVIPHGDEIDRLLRSCSMPFEPLRHARVVARLAERRREARRLLLKSQRLLLTPIWKEM